MRIDEEKKIFFTKIFNITFLECLKYFREDKDFIKEDLEGFKRFSSIKDLLIIKHGKEYTDMLFQYLKDFQEIINNKKARERRSKKVFFENKILTELSKDDNITYSKVSIFQFYGLEIDNFAVAVARTALLIAENQMYNATNRIIALREAPLPLKKHENIKHDDALKVSWDFVKGDKIFIIGNPPFLGYSNQEDEQKKELKNIFRDESGKFYKCSGKIDYVAGWYFKACEFMQNNKNKNVKSAFVSTNSITQGEQVTNIFKILRERFKIQIDFAYKNFRWENKAENIAHVYVVIIGFSLQNEKNEKNEKYNDAPKKLFIDDKNFKLVKHINFYLTEGPDVFIEARKNPICENVPVMIAGGKPVEGGNLILTAEERDELLKSDPIAKKFIRPFMGGEDFLKRKPRFDKEARPLQFRNY